MAFYTGQGDTGRSGTKTRMNIPKSSPVFDLIGTLEEASAALGNALHSSPAAVHPVIEELRKHLAALVDEVAGKTKFATAEQVAHLESAIDTMTASLPEDLPLHGSSAGGAALDVARTVIRRAERHAVAASQTGGITRELLAWLNRLSSLLFALSCVCDAAHTAPAPPAVSISGNALCDDALRLCLAVRAKAREMGFHAVAAVCDAGGNPVVLLRDDDALIASVDIAANKAFTAVSLKMSTADLAPLAAPGGSLYGIQETNKGRIVVFGGGAPLVRDGSIVGGLGVSGGTAQQDTALCEYGLQYFEKEM